MFNKTIHTVLLVLLSASLLVSPAVAAPQPAPIKAAAATDTLVEVTLGQPETLDPALDYETRGQEVIQQVYETLVTYNREKQDEFVPQLATAWTISADGKTYTFNIRSGVRFHNGDSLTPAVVAYSFQRGLLQGGSASPQWLLFQPIMGTTNNNDISDLVNPAGGLTDNRSALQAANAAWLTSACQQVKNAITFDAAAGTVTFHLQQAWNPFLVTLAGPFSSVMDPAWVKAHGGWDGSCATWQNYYAPSSDEANATAIGSGENGTGAFSLNDWSPSQIVLARNPTYWRTTPAWTGGPSGPAALNWVKIENISAAATRTAMLISGDADMGTFDYADFPGLDPSVMLRYAQGTDNPILINPAGVLKRYENLQSISATDGFFNYNIDPGSSMIGNGLLDEHGIPTDFFTDIHVRKAFNAAFDWDTYITDVYGGQAVQRRGPIIAGLPGYTDTQPVYSHDATQAMTEFTQAWSGDVVAKGFTFTLTYNTGNLAREKFSKILKLNIEALSPKFHIIVVKNEWADYLALQQSNAMPIRVSGWQEDIPDPYNWISVYMGGGYFSWIQHMPAAMLSLFEPGITTCLQLVGTAAATCYANLQGMAYDQAIDIFLAQPVFQNYIRNEVQGYYANPILGSAPLFYALSKSSLPVTSPVAPDAPRTVNFTEPGGAADSVIIPSGSFSDTVNVVVAPGGVSAGQTTGFRLGQQGFDISAFQLDGTQLHPTFDSGHPVMVTIHYNPVVLNGIPEDTLKLYYLNPQTGNWEDASCGVSQLDRLSRTITVPVCHFSRFALGGAFNFIHLPIIKK